MLDIPCGVLVNLHFMMSLQQLSGKDKRRRQTLESFPQTEYFIFFQKLHGKLIICLSAFIL